MKARDDDSDNPSSSSDTSDSAESPKRADLDNDFGFAEYDSPGRTMGEVHTDKQYDEAIDVSDENVSTPDSSPTQPVGQDFGASPPRQDFANQQLARRDRDESTESDTSSDSDTSKHPGQYDASEYEGLNVSPEIKELFQYITRFKPQTVDLQTQFKPFIPDLVPSVGEVDGFIKIPRPDGKQDGVGLSQLDEPTMNPSDPTVLDLQLRSTTKAAVEPMEVRAIESAERNPKEVASWIGRIADLHRMKPAPTVQYSRRMPDIDSLMQAWSPEFEQFISNHPLPSADLDLPLAEYVKLLGVILDVPVHSCLTDTLHVILTLYLEFKNNPQFGQREEVYGGGGMNVTPSHDEPAMAGF